MSKFTGISGDAEGLKLRGCDFAKGALALPDKGSVSSFSEVIRGIQVAKEFSAFYLDARWPHLVLQ